MLLFITLSNILLFLDSVMSASLSIDRIVNGTVAKPESAKSQVWVRQQKTEKIYRMCGGILVSPTKVLTAAHCLIPGGGPVSVRYGTHNLKQLYKPDIIASDFVIHPFWYSMNHDYDIAIITLSESIPEDSRVRYAELQTDDLPAGSIVDIYGWGYTSGTNRTIPVQMQHTTLETEDCSWTRKTICGRSATSIACQGDSGGSMLSRDGKALGVLSAVSKGCPIGGLNIYTKIPAHHTFISEHL